MKLIHQLEKQHNRNKILFLLCLWSLIVLPCCWLGYGSDEDAWAVGEEASIIWNTGHYSLSRSTGFPLHELLMAFSTHFGGWYAANFFSYGCGLAVAFFLVLLININHFKNPLWVLSGILFLPQIIVNSSSTLDYMPSLALFTASYFFFTQKKFFLSALLIGISCGFRPSNGAFILPLIFAQFLEDKNYQRGIRMFLTALFFGVLSYSPVLLQYGILDPTREVKVPFLQNILIGGYQGLILFGIWQSVFLGALFLFYFFSIKREFHRSLYIRFHVLNILMWLLFFIFITSSEAEYLFPLLFSVIFLADAVFKTSHFKMVVIALISYNFFSLELLGGESGNRKITARPEWGFTIRDIQDRRYKLWYREATTNYQCKKKTLLMYGFIYVKPDNDAWEYSTIAQGIIKQKNGNLYLSERILDEDVLKKLQEENFDIYVWNNRKWEYITLKLDFWKKYIKVVYDMEKFLGSKKRGKLVQ
ncbi:MAG TPA: hypothetical protein VK766_09290 [Cytophagaceae bacterium]|jgi:hypothetical protein|nr:hypothetical protein [Cytophagaceae bacterium]